MRKKISLSLKFIIGLFVITGMTLAIIFAERDGYSDWYRRLLYFTQQSNIWIGATCLSMAILSLVKKENQKRDQVLYLLKFIFTVSITITGVTYCALLAPFAGDDYNAWTFCSVITHVIVPILSVLDFFIDDFNITYGKKHIYSSLIPPALYLVFALILGAFNVEFGLGKTYPYFFMDIKGDAGLFGFVNSSPPQLGVVYWLILFLFIVLGFAYLYSYIHDKRKRKID